MEQEKPKTQTQKWRDKQGTPKKEIDDKKKLKLLKEFSDQLGFSNVKSHLDLKGTKITALPKDLSVGGNIYKDF